MIADKIKEIRLQNKMNKSEMAKKLGIPYTTYNNYENGEREPGSIFLIKFSNIFDVSIDYLMGTAKEFSEIKKNDTIADIILRLRTDESYLEVVKELGNLTDEQFAAVKSFLLAFKK